MSDWCVIIRVVDGNPPAVDFVMDDESGRVAVMRRQEAENYVNNSIYWSIDHVVPVADIEACS